jgi:uncharacterized repeat protein (TIGR01451 family)
LVVDTKEAEAAATLPFRQAFSANANGTVLTIGNTLMTCSPTVNNCTNALGGGAYDNNYFWMRLLDADQDPSTFNSSMSTLALPDGAQVLWARLYWGARLDAGASGSGTAGDASKAAQVAFKAPGASAYQTLTGTQLAQNGGQQNAYQSFVDVTNLVRDAGNGDYWAGNVQAGSGTDRYAGWALTIAYTAPGLPLRNLTVFEGFNTVGSGYPQNIDVSGFTAPLNGPVDAQLSMVVYEGDLSQTGDYALLNSSQLATAVSPGTNFFDSINSLNGASVTTRTPADRNMLGFDIKNLGASGIIPNGATSARFSFSSAGDVYYPGVLALAINLYAPDFTTSTKTAVNLTSADVAKPGDVIQYVLTYNNTGQDPAAGSRACDPLPAGLDYVPGSMTLLTTPDPAVAPTLPLAMPDNGASFGSYAAGKVCVNLGRGATPTAGGTIEVGDSTSFQFQGKVSDSAGGTTLRNIAHLDYQTGTTHVAAQYDTPPVLTPVALKADVRIQKSLAPSEAVAGQGGQTTLVVTNAGPNQATGVVVTDPLPADYTATSVTWVTAPVSSPAQSGTCPVPAAGAPVVCPLPDLARGDQAQVLIAGATASSSVATTLSNVASVATTSFDPDLSNNVDTASIPMTHQADLKIEKTPATATVTPGEKISWTLTVTNQCNHATSTNPGGCLSDAVGVVISDTAPDPAKLVLTKATGAGASGTTQVAVTCPATLPSPSTFQCQVAGDGRLRPGQTAVITVEGYVMGNLTGGTVQNQAGVTSDTFDPVQSDNTATAVVTPGQPVADIQLKKSGPATVMAGGRYNYTITAQNFGPSDASAVTVADALAGTGLVADGSTFATSDRGTCAVAAGTVSCDLGSLPGPSAPGSADGGAIATITITGVLVPANSNATSLTNTAAITCAGQACPAPPGPTPHPDSPSVTSDVQTSADLSVTKVGSTAADPPPNSQVTYTITVKNNGPSDSRGAWLMDSVPAGLTLSALNVTTGGGTCNEVLGTCDLGTVPAGATRVITAVGTVSPVGLTENEQTVEVGSLWTDDPDTGNNEAIWKHSPNPQADLALEKSTPPPGFRAGVAHEYQLVVTNNGPDASGTITITDTLPDGVTAGAFDASVPCTASADKKTVTCLRAASLQVGQSWGFLFPVNVDPGLERGTPIFNTATVESPLDDPSLANNTAWTLDLVHSEANVNVEYSILYPGPGSDPCASPTGTAPAYTGAGSLRCAQIRVGNTGPSTARDVQIRSDVAVSAIPDQTSFPDWCTAVNQELVCNLAAFTGDNELRPGMSLSFKFPFTIAPNTPAGTYVDCGHSATCAGGPGGWATVATSTYETDFSDNLDTAPLEIGAPQTNLQMAKTALTTIPNPNGDGHDSYVAGEKFGYRIDLSVPARLDTGYGLSIPAADASDVQLTDTVPAGFLITQVNTSQGTCDPITTPVASVSCSLGTVKASTDAANTQVISVYVYGTVPVGATAEIIPDGGAVNIALATSPTPGPGGAPTSVTATAATDVVELGDLAVSKLADVPVSYAGASVGYTVTTINNGPSNAPDAVLFDTLPLGLTLDPANSPGCALERTESDGRQVVKCELGDIAVSASVNTRIVATSDPRDLRPYWCPGKDGVNGQRCDSVVLPPADLGDEYPRDLLNQVEVTSAAVDTKTANNRASVTTQLRALADIAITAGVSTDTPSAGSELTYSLTGVNNGPSALDNPVVVSVFPKGFQVLAVDESYMDCTTSHVGEGLEAVYTVTCVGWKVTPIRDSFQPGINVPGTVTVLVPPGIPAGAYDATAQAYSRSPVRCTDPTDPPAGAGTCESDYSNNQVTVTVNVVQVADTSIEKRLVAPIPIQAGAEVTYELTVANAGPSVANNVTISDTVPEGLTYISGSFGSGGTCPAPEFKDDQTVANCGLGALAPQQSIVATLVFRVDDGFTGEVCNAAMVGSGALDNQIGNNTSTACSTPAPQTDVGVELTADTPQVAVGSAGRLTAVVTNHGPAAAPATQVVFTLPAGLADAQVVAASASGGGPLPGCTSSGQVFTCVIGELAVGGTVTYTITGTATGAPGDSLAVQAAVTHDLVDTDPGNDTSQASLSLTAEPSPSPTEPSPGPTGATPAPTASGHAASPSPSGGGSSELPFSGSHAPVLGVAAALVVLLGSALVARSHRRLSR